MLATGKNQSPTHQQQTVSGVSFMIHQMLSYPLQQRKTPSGWMAGQNFALF